MIYDLNDPTDAKRAEIRLKSLQERKKKVELKEVRNRRSISQNSYLHLILTWFALEYGERTEYIKQVFFKQIVNPEIFRTEYANRMTGEIREDWRSTSDLDTKELTTAIDRFRNFAIKEAGIYLPEPSDLATIQKMELQIKNLNSNFL